MTGNTSDLHRSDIPVRGKVSPTFKYAPLPPGENSFRLLRILPSISASPFPIHCELINSSLYSHDFIAGSYVWGPPEPKKIITLNGSNVWVRKNLMHFLCACRSSLTPRLIWIDALCINQSDKEEKSHQVRLMDRIYTNAEAVYCWMGWENKRLFSNIIHYNSRNQKRLSRTSRDFRPLLHQLRALAQVEYFRRMWIVQEFVLAREIYLLAGRKEIQWSSVERLLTTHTPADATLIEELESSMDFSDPGTSRMLQMRQYRQRLAPWNFEELFHAFHAMSCSFPQDRVFALLGLVDAEHPHEPMSTIINYKSTPWQLLRDLIQARCVGKSPTSLLSFTHTYAENVIMGAVDRAMDCAHSWALTGSVETPGCQQGSCMADESHKTPTRPHLCLRAWVLKKWHEYGYFKDCMNIHTHTWSDVPDGAYRMLEVYQSWHSLSQTQLQISLMVDVCAQACEGICIGHAVIGLSVSQRRRRDWQLPAFAGRPMALTKRDGHLLHARAQTQTLIAAMQGLQSSMHAVRKQETSRVKLNYTVNTDLKTLVQLSHMVKELESAFQSELLTEPESSSSSAETG